MTTAAHRPRCAESDETAFVLEPDGHDIVPVWRHDCGAGGDVPGPTARTRAEVHV